MNEMNYEDFKRILMEEAKKLLPYDYKDATVSEQRMIKLDNTYDGLCISSPRSVAAPAFNLNAIYQKYQQGYSMDRIAESIIESLPSTQTADFHDLNPTNYSFVKDKLFIRVNNAEKNREALSNMPHTRVEDLAITYHVDVSPPNGNGVVSFAISNDLLKSYGISQAQLHRDAMENSPRIFPPRFQSLRTVLADADITPDSAADPHLYMLTNERSINGASVMFYDHIQDQIASALGGDYVVLPSSIHEVLIHKDDGKISYSDLERMVSQANKDVVEPSEQLSNNVYHYDSHCKKLETVDGYIQRINQDQSQRQTAQTQNQQIISSTQKSEAPKLASIKMKF